LQPIRECGECLLSFGSVNHQAKPGTICSCAYHIKSGLNVHYHTCTLRLLPSLDSTCSRPWCIYGHIHACWAFVSLVRNLVGKAVRHVDFPPDTTTTGENHLEAAKKSKMSPLPACECAMTTRDPKACGAGKGTKEVYYLLHSWQLTLHSYLR